MTERLEGDIPFELNQADAAGPSPEELQQRPELAKLYRPLDHDDRPWMEQLGCDWPIDEVEEDEWLGELNNLVAIGREVQSSHPDEYAPLIYESREEFYALLPVAQAAWRRLQAYAQRVKGRRRTTPLRPVPLDTFISGQRAIHDLSPTANASILAANPTVIHISGKEVQERVGILVQQGIDPKNLLKKPAQSGRWLSSSARGISTNIQTLYGIARAFGVKDNKSEVRRFVEKSQADLARSPYIMLALARLSSELFRRQAMREVPMDEVRQVLHTSTTAIIAAYLARRSIISAPQGLTYQARWLDEEYTRDELRGYIIRHADNRVVQSYLRAHPVTKGETERLQLLDELPQHDLDWAGDRDYGEDAYRTRTTAENRAVFLHHIRNMPPSEKEQQDEWLDDIAVGLQVEESGRSDFKHDRVYIAGVEARKRLHASFAAQVLEIRSRSGGPMFPEETEDAVQDGMLKLMLAVLNLARRHKEDRPDDNWEFLERQIRYVVKLSSPEDEDGADNITVHTSEIPGQYGGVGELDSSESTPSDNRAATAEQLAALLERFGKTPERRRAGQ